MVQGWLVQDLGFWMAGGRCGSRNPDKDGYAKASRNIKTLYIYVCTVCIYVYTTYSKTSIYRSTYLSVDLSIYLAIYLSRNRGSHIDTKPLLPDPAAYREPSAQLPKLQATFPPEYRLTLLQGSRDLVSRVMIGAIRARSRVIMIPALLATIDSYK